MNNFTIKLFIQKFANSLLCKDLLTETMASDLSLILNHLY